MKIPIIFTVTIVLLSFLALQAVAAKTMPKASVSVAPATFDPRTGPAIISYDLQNMTDPRVTIRVTDNNGATVKTWDIGATGDGRHCLAWDGKDDRGRTVAQGTYRVNVSVLTTALARQQYTHRLSVPEAAGKPGTFHYPYYVAADADGNIFVTDNYHHCVRKFDRYGNFLLEWGGYGTDNGKFRYPAGIAIDSSGDIYVVDTGNNRVQKFDSDGRFLLEWGSYGTDNGKFRSPCGLAIDGDGNVLVADRGNCRIQLFSAAGDFLAAWGSAGSDDGQFRSPSCIAVAPDGRIYVTDSKAMRVQVFTPSGKYLSGWGSPGSGRGQLDAPYGIAIDSAGQVFVADGKNNRVQVFDLDGNFLATGGQKGSGDGQFNVPVGVALAGDSLIVVDCRNHRFQVLSPRNSTGREMPVTFTALADVAVDGTSPSNAITAPANDASYSRADAAADSGMSPYTGPAVQFICSNGARPAYKVELARTPAEINRGLMYRTGLAEDAGMLFVFGGDHRHYFHMANTYIPLDMVYISSENVVVGVYENATPLNTSPITPPGPCRYVLEINGGQCARQGIKAGDRVKIIGVQGFAESGLKKEFQAPAA